MKLQSVHMMMGRLFFTIVLFLGFAAGCAPAGGVSGTITALPPNDTPAAPAASPLPAHTPSSVPSLTPTPSGLRILALGDSYTIGQGVDEGDRWPVQLAERMEEQGQQVGEVKIIARTGWTTADLDAAITMADPKGPFDLVTLLIGVNDQYRGRPAADYEPQFRDILARAVGYAGGRPERVVVLSIPDWGVTPFAAGLDASRIAAEIDAYNRINRRETEAAGAWYVDVTPVSREASADPALLASDGLHPSDAMYARWVELVFPIVQKILSNGFSPQMGMSYPQF